MRHAIDVCLRVSNKQAAKTEKFELGFGYALVVSAAGIHNGSIGICTIFFNLSKGCCYCCVSLTDDVCVYSFKESC